MRPDIEDDEIPPVEELAADDLLLKSLCQFDIAYCFVVATEGEGKAGFYPSSAALNEDRAKPIAQKIVTSPEIRRRLFPNSDDTHIAQTLDKVYEFTVRESASNYYGRWWDTPPSVRQFIDQHNPKAELE